MRYKEENIYRAFTSVPTKFGYIRSKLARKMQTGGIIFNVLKICVRTFNSYLNTKSFYLASPFTSETTLLPGDIFLVFSQKFLFRRGNRIEFKIFGMKLYMVYFL